MERLPSSGSVPKAEMERTMSRNQAITRVLVVDDDMLVIEMIKALLTEVRFETVGIATDGQRAITLTRELEPDVVVMDLNMPVMDGVDATRAIYHCCPTPIVVLSAYENPDLVERVSQAGAGAYLLKPPSPKELERAIIIAIARFDDMMSLRRLNDELAQRNEELVDALAHIQRLRGLLPICSHCKKIRDDAGYWQEVECYIAAHADVQFSHGICPNCLETLYPDFVRSLT
jgi:AmiR/NasT family two-component response regulator